MWNKIKTILGLLFIGGIIIAPTNDERIIADAKKYGLFDWIADCFAPGGVNDQTEKYGTLGIYLRGLESFDDGKGHYATNNRHNANNSFDANRVELSTKPIIFVLLLFIGYGYFRSSKLKACE